MMVRGAETQQGRRRPGVDVVARAASTRRRRRRRRRRPPLLLLLLLLLVVVVMLVLLRHVPAAVAAAEDAAAAAAADTADPAGPADPAGSDRPKAFRGTAGEDDSIVWVWWAYARDSAAAFFAHWDDVPSNPFKIVVAFLGILFWPFGVAAHFAGNHFGAPALLNEYVGDYINGHNVSVYYRMLLGYRQEL